MVLYPKVIVDLSHIQSLQYVNSLYDKIRIAHFIIPVNFNKNQHFKNKSYRHFKCTP